MASLLITSAIVAAWTAWLVLTDNREDRPACKRAAQAEEAKYTSLLQRTGEPR